MVNLKRIVRNYLAHYSGLPMPVWHGIILSSIESLFIGVYYFLPIYFINHLKFNIVTAGTMVSFFGFGTILGGYVGGKLSDTYGSDIVGISSLFIQTIVFILLAKLSSPYLLSMTLFIMGFCSYAFITSSHLWVLDKCHFENQRLKAINILNVGSNLGLALSAILIGLLASYSFKLIFILGSLCLTLLVIYFLFLRSKENKSWQEHAHPLEKSLNDINISLNQTTYLVFVCLFFMGFIIFQTNTTYSLFLQNTFPDLGIRALSILFGLNCLLVVFFQAPVVNVFSKYNKILIMGMGALLIGLGMMFLNFGNVFSLAVIACIIYTIGEMLFFSVAQLVCYQNGGQNKKGKAMGLYRMIYAASRVIAPVIGTIIFSQLGSSSLWYLCGLLGIVCLFSCFYHKNASTVSVT